MKEKVMEQRSNSTAVLVAIGLLAGLVLAIANVVVWLQAVGRAATEVASVAALYRSCPPCLIYFTGAPLVIASALALVVARTASLRADAVPAARPLPSAGTPPRPPTEGALHLLGLLQQEGRFLDFIAEDIDAYSDAQVGAAVRSIHAGCRKALRERIELQRILSEEDGSPIVIKENFDPAVVRLTGNVTGAPPFHGTVQHGGWRAARISLPESAAGADARIIAPAEVEIP
jgi:hypothetical protein